MALTDAQLTTLAAHIRANQDPVIVAALIVRGDGDIAKEYNKDASVYVWKSSIQPAEYRAAVVWTEVDQMTSGAARIWDWVTSGMTLPLDGSDANVRQGIADAFGQSTTTRANLLSIAKRLATLAESIFATGTGSEASPATLVFEGQLQPIDVAMALNNNPAQ